MKTPDPGTPRLRDAAVVLPLLAVFLLMPPVIRLFTGAHTVAGVPLIIVYLFGVWLALIVAAALLARRLAPPPASGLPGSGPPGSGLPGSGLPRSAPPASVPPAMPAGAQPDETATH